MPTTSKLQLLLCLLVYERSLYILLLTLILIVLLCKPQATLAINETLKAHCPQTMVSTVFLGDYNVT